ncbi:uncharacterized protein LOC105688519 [Athalia rosae]|uniref:uncharacterized protein LOC105688519 n=1 Tax=Athalia rosae TaxID=37344 RepID=UPI002034684F|nr:uncharacterized protein LOC105688519 [Athalia rosae]
MALIFGARNWLVIFVIAAACTCGARTECDGRGQISLLTGIHEDGSCRKVSSRGVLLYEAAQIILEQYNAKTNGFKLEIQVLDTCGSISGALKAAMKALVSADVSCLQPPHYLGIIGPDNPTNAEAVQKVTSVLRVPHLVRKSSSSAFLHHLAMENNSYIVQGVLEVIERLKWKSFTLIAPTFDGSEDDVQNIAKKLTVEAIAKNLCVIVHDNEEGDFTSNVIHVGKPEDSFFAGPSNATVLVVSEGSLENQLNRVNSSNTIILVEDDRNQLSELQVRVEKSKWWTGGRTGKFDPEELRDVRWLQDAIETYGTALDSICKKKKCKSQVNSADWNEMIAKILSSQNDQSVLEPRGLNILIKSKDGEMESLGEILVKENEAIISWKDTKPAIQTKKKGVAKTADEEEEDDDETLPEVLKKIAEKSKNDETTEGCLSELHEAKLTKDEEEQQGTHIVVSEMDDTEWWTMVGTVSGVGVAMFVVGILAVYIVYTNIRGPRSPKGQSSSRRHSIETGQGSPRRVGSDREMPTSGGGRSQRQQRQQRPVHRRDSVQSNISDRSV